MTALEMAAKFTADLDEKHFGYQLSIARPEALMVSVAVPGERWEIEFFDDGHVELERFISHGVDDTNYALEDIVSLLGNHLNDDDV